jgi:uncharacterized protein YdhG (YjbR/CyaY superfamily)
VARPTKGLQQMAGKTSSDGLSADERAAVKERAAELRAQAKAADKREAGLSDVLAAIAKLDGSDQKLASRIHEIVTAAAPTLVPKTYYGMPGWANEDGKIVCFFQPASKFKVRYGTFAFEQPAALDDGTMWPTAWALLEMTPAHEKAITELVKRAIG